MGQPKGLCCRMWRSQVEAPAPVPPFCFNPVPASLPTFASDSMETPLPDSELGHPVRDIHQNFTGSQPSPCLSAFPGAHSHESAEWSLRAMGQALSPRWPELSSLKRPEPVCPSLGTCLVPPEQGPGISSAPWPSLQLVRDWLFPSLRTNWAQRDTTKEAKTPP